MKADRIFDGISERFRRQIYANDNPKGKIRLHILQRDLSALVCQASPLHVLDAGAGMGQMSVWLAGCGHQVTTLEPAQEMLDHAVANIQLHGLQDRVSIQKNTIQEWVAQAPGTYDLIICHAVLEWLAEPLATLQRLLSLLKDGGRLSLMFFNQHSRTMRHLQAGQLKTVLEPRSITPDTLTSLSLSPISPLLPQQVLDWLKQAGLALELWSGVRCFYDYTYPQLRKQLDLQQVLALEARYSQQEPWRSLARYQHMLCRRPG
ncbi:MAG: methyltransferase domain-containing protein [Thiothrix sp.]|nr:methyltransferase domain-containing protein [Thiothrix sp.]HPE58756.1 methyltransferase domain-containing protein [Thiolinea sp.]